MADFFLFSTLKRMADARASGAEQSFLDAAGSELNQRLGKTAIKDGSNKDVTVINPLPFVIWIIALVIAVRCRGGRFMSVIWALFFPTLYVTIFVGGNLLGSPNARCGGAGVGGSMGEQQWGEPPYQQSYQYQPMQQTPYGDRGGYGGGGYGGYGYGYGGSGYGY